MLTVLLRTAVCALLVSSIAGFGQRKSVPPAASAAARPIQIVVDATHAPEKILHAQLQIPVAPAQGLVTLVYPKWIPGEHGPTGPINDVTGIEFYANGQRLTWKRDLDEMFALHVNVPASVSTLEARLDLLLPAPAEGFSSGASATAQLDMVSWNQLVLYQSQPGKHSDDISITASLRLPVDWHYGTALPLDNEGNGQINFRTISLTTLVDSPVLTGRHFRRIPLTPEGPIQHYLDIAADSEAAANHLARHTTLKPADGKLPSN